MLENSFKFSRLAVIIASISPSSMLKWSLNAAKRSLRYYRPSPFFLCKSKVYSESSLAKEEMQLSL